MTRKVALYPSICGGENFPRETLILCLVLYMEMGSDLLYISQSKVYNMDMDPRFMKPFEF